MIHPSAVVSPRAKLGENVQIGAFCLIHDDVEIGDNCEIQAYCELGVATPRSNRGFAIARIQA